MTVTESATCHFSLRDTQLLYRVSAVKTAYTGHANHGDSVGQQEQEEETEISSEN